MGPFGTLSPSNSSYVILVDPGGVFPLSDPPPGGTLPLGEEGLPSCPDGVGTPAVVYYGDSLCDSDESDWEDQCDVVGQQYVDDYNFDVPDRMDLKIFERGGGRLDQKCWIWRGRI